MNVSITVYAGFFQIACALLTLLGVLIGALGTGKAGRIDYEC